MFFQRYLTLFSLSILEELQIERKLRYLSYKLYFPIVISILLTQITIMCVQKRFRRFYLNVPKCMHPLILGPVNLINNRLNCIMR